MFHPDSKETSRCIRIPSRTSLPYKVRKEHKAFCSRRRLFYQTIHDIIDRYVDIVFANETEARAFTKIADPEQALEEIARHCSTAVVKVGKDGSWVKSTEEKYHIPAWPADPVDATGAGDTYAAGFLYAHSLGLPLRMCGDIGSIIAAKVVEVIGTKMDVKRWRQAEKEIEELIRSNE